MKGIAMSTTPPAARGHQADPLDDDVVLLLDAIAGGPAGGTGAARARLFERVARSARASRDFHTVRRDAPGSSAGAGILLARCMRPQATGRRRPASPSVSSSSNSAPVPAGTPRPRPAANANGS